MDNKKERFRSETTNTELYIITGHDRDHLSIDALDQENMTCCVTTCTYSRPPLAVKALVRYRKSYGQYHASARPIKSQHKISTHSCRPVPAYIPRNRRCACRGILSLWSFSFMITVVPRYNAVFWSKLFPPSFSKRF